MKKKRKKNIIANEKKTSNIFKIYDSKIDTFRLITVAKLT